MKAQWGYKARPTSDLKHWLSGIVRCSACGGTLIFTLPHYYKCANYAKGRCVHSQHIKVDLLADALISKLEKDASTFEPLAYDVTYTGQSGGHDLARLETALKQLQLKKSRLQEAYLSGVLDLQDFAAAKKEIECGVKQMQQEIQAFRQKSDEAAVKKALQASIASALKTLTAPDASLEEKNNAARSIIENCTFDKASSTLAITYRLTW